MVYISRQTFEFIRIILHNAFMEWIVLNKEVSILKKEEWTHTNEEMFTWTYLKHLEDELDDSQLPNCWSANSKSVKGKVLSPFGQMPLLPSSIQASHLLAPGVNVATTDYMVISQLNSI